MRAKWSWLTRKVQSVVEQCGLVIDWPAVADFSVTPVTRLHLERSQFCDFESVISHLPLEKAAALAHLNHRRKGLSLTLVCHIGSPDHLSRSRLSQIEEWALATTAIISISKLLQSSSLSTQPARRVHPRQTKAFTFPLPRGIGLDLLSALYPHSFRSISAWDCRPHPLYPQLQTICPASQSLQPWKLCILSGI